jgi:hypothetical protein
MNRKWISLVVTVTIAMCCLTMTSTDALAQTPNGTLDLGMLLMELQPQQVIQVLAVLGLAVGEVLSHSKIRDKRLARKQN